jgi:uncharacterized protein (TIGR03435 family)
MIVEAIFWFHPLVWWIGARLVEERERACDEGVLSLGSEPQVYAEAILNVCKLYVESPLACVSGVTGSDLKKRIEAIMTNRMVFRLNFAKKAALAVAGIAALAVPIVVGTMNAPRLRAQSPPAAIAPALSDPPIEPPAPPAVPPVARQQEAPPDDDSPQQEDPKLYVIGAEDVLSIAVFHEPDLTRTASVSADGKIKMPLIGDIQAADLTIERFTAQLKAALSTYVKNPDVTVTVMQVNSKHAAQPMPVFEVASIKPCGSDPGGMAKGGGRSGGGPGGQGPSPDRLNLACQPIKSLIRMAYINFEGGRRRLPGGPMPPIDGGPSWLDSERYKVDAKAEGAPGQEMMRGPMLQALLEDRLKLRVRRESREVPVYALTVAKGGPKLTPFQEGSCVVLDFSNPPLPGPGGDPPMICTFAMRRRNGTSVKWETRGSTLDEFARSLGGDLDRIIINKTGITGKYDFHLEFAPDETTAGLNELRVGPNGEPGFPQPTASDPPGAPSIFTAIQQLGLKLESAKGPRDFLVIERAEKPSEN